MPSAAVSHLADPVTRHMRADFARLALDQTVGEAIAAARGLPPEGRIIYFYVLDAAGRLAGVVPTRRLLLAPDATPIRDVMVTRVVAIPAAATVLDACEFFLLHKLLAFPVVDDERRMLGIVDVDLYTEELADVDRRQDLDDLFQLIGVHFEDAHARSPVAAFRSRFPWLLANIAGGIMAAFLSGLFQAELEKAVALALFVPVVLALAESVAIQSVSIALQRLHGRPPSLGGILRSVRHESLTGMLLGAASAAAVALVALAWLGQRAVAAALLGGITGGVVCAAAIGVAMPNLLRLFAREPQVAAGPVALAATDMVTLVIYFSLARQLLG
ncbi:MAG: magnesium transporter [Planctomycetaceae bacterium]|jgi:magnesium transporter|nr:magnesium transporter [Planctomycetaceae bacterium]